MNNEINKCIIKTMDNDAAIINTAIELADDECNVMNKITILQRSQVGKEFRIATHKCNNSVTCDGKHVHLKSNPSIATYQQHVNTPMSTYDSSADRHYLSEKDRTKLGLPILRISDKKVGVDNGGACNGKYIKKYHAKPLSRESTFKEVSVFSTSVDSKSNWHNAYPRTSIQR